LEEVDSIIWEVGKNPAGRGPRIVRAKKNGIRDNCPPNFSFFFFLNRYRTDEVEVTWRD